MEIALIIYYSWLGISAGAIIFTATIRQRATSEVLSKRSGLIRFEEKYKIFIEERFFTSFYKKYKIALIFIIINIVLTSITLLFGSILISIKPQSFNLQIKDKAPGIVTIVFFILAFITWLTGILFLRNLYLSKKAVKSIIRAPREELQTLDEFQVKEPNEEVKTIFATMGLFSYNIHMKQNIRVINKTLSSVLSDTKKPKQEREDELYFYLICDWKYTLFLDKEYELNDIAYLWQSREEYIQ